MRRGLLLSVAILLVAAPASVLAKEAATNAPSGNAQPLAKAGAADVARPILDRLDAAWTKGDGAAFAAQFTEDADVINVNGTPFRGRPAIARQMQLIFDTAFKGSTHQDRRLEEARNLTPDIVLVVSSATIAVPTGPLAPEARSRQTFLMVRDEGQWRIRHWHNTPIRAAQAERD